MKKMCVLISPWFPWKLPLHNMHVSKKSGNTFNVARGLKNKINNYAKIQNLAPNLIVLPMVFDTYRNMDVKSEEFCTELFGRLMSQADRRYTFKLANFRQRSSLVAARQKLVKHYHTCKVDRVTLTK